MYFINLILLLFNLLLMIGCTLTNSKSAQPISVITRLSKFRKAQLIHPNRLLPQTRRFNLNSTQRNYNYTTTPTLSRTINHHPTYRPELTYFSRKQINYRLVPDTLLERIALLLGKVPTPLFDVGILPILCETLIQATELGILPLLAENEHSLEDIAKICELDERVLKLVLDILESSGYLKSNNGLYQMKPYMKKYFHKDSNTSLINMIKVSNIQREFLKNIPNLIKIGRGIRFHDTYKNLSNLETYQKGMFELSRLSAHSIAKHIPAKKSTGIILDIGGSHGLCGSVIAEKHNMDKSIVLELPEAVDIATKNFAFENVEYRCLNILQEELNIDCDIIFLGNILHNFDREEISSILEKAHNNLTEGGTIAILDFLPDVNRNATDLLQTCFSLFFHSISESECYLEKDYYRFLSSKGFKDIQTKSIIEVPSHKLIIAKK